MASSSVAKEMESPSLNQPLPIELIAQSIAIFFGGDAFKWNNKEVVQSLVSHFTSLGYDPYMMALSSDLNVLNHISKITAYVPCYETINQAAIIGNYEVLCHLITIKTRGIHDNNASFLRKLKRRLYLLAYHGHLETLKKCCRLIQELSQEICEEITYNAALSGHIEILDWLLKNRFFCATEAYCASMGSQNYDQIMAWLIKNNCGYSIHSVIKAAVEYNNSEGLKSFIENCMKGNKYTDTFWEQYIYKANQECFEYITTLMQGPFDEAIIVIAIRHGYLGTLDVIWKKEFEMINNGVFDVFDLMCKREIGYTSVDTLRWFKDHGYEFDLRSVKWAIRGISSNIEVIKFLIEVHHISQLDEKACQNAVKWSQLEILQYLFEKRCPINHTKCLQIAMEKVMTSPDNEAAHEVLKWLQTRQ